MKLFGVAKIKCYYKFMEVKIIRQKRKTMVLKVLNSQVAELHIPIKMSAYKIEEFLESKRDWLNKAQKRMLENENFSNYFDLQKYVYVNGEKVYNVNCLAMDYDNFTDEKKHKVLRKHYLSLFQQMEKLAYELSEKTGLTFKQLKSCDSTRIWGSYNSDRIMKLNWKLVVLPKRLAYYVVCHELCHSLHFNHKPQFWKDVEKICPDYKKLKGELKKYSFILRTKF